MTQAIQGACLCGTVRFEVDGPLSSMLHCHCSMCRKHHGSPFATLVSAPLMGFRWLAGEDNIDKYASSERGVRGFCRTCGSVTPTLLPQMDIVLCPAGNLQGDLDIRPQFHVFTGSKASWYDITDDLPQHAEFPPEFNARGVERPKVEPRTGIVEGSCLCGKVAYEITGKPRLLMYCHCTRCRRGRSSAHGSNLFYKLDQFHFTRGAELVVQFRPPDAERFAIAFCSCCGGAAPQIAAEFNSVVVPAGTLDTDPDFRPVAHIFVGSKANWFDITGDVPQFPEMTPRPPRPAPPAG